MDKQPLLSPLVNENGLNEVLYTAVLQMSSDEKRSLPDRIRKHLKTFKSAQRFISKSSTDQKRELLQYMEYASFLTITPAGNIGAKKFIRVFNEYVNGNIQAGVVEAAKSGVFVSSDVEFSFYLGQMSQSMTTSPYAKNLELIRAANILKKWPKKLPKESNDDYDYMSEVIAKIIVWSGVNFEQTETAVGLPSDLLKILFFMYLSRGNYISKEEMYNYFPRLIGEKKLSGIIKFLLDNYFIQKHINWREKKYTITKTGIRTVHQFRDRVLKSFNF